MRSFLIFLVVCATAYASVYAQANQYLTRADSDPRALGLLDKMAKHLEQERVSMDFEMSITYPGENPVMYKGRLMQQGHSYRIITDGVEIWCNGKDRWIYSKDVNEVNLYSAHTSEVPGPLGLIAEYTGDQYIAILDGTDRIRSFDVQSLELKPVDRDSEIAKVRLFVKQDASPARIEIFEKSAARTVCDILKIGTPENQSEIYFTFNKADYPDAHIEDLRID